MPDDAGGRGRFEEGVAEGGGAADDAGERLKVVGPVAAAQEGVARACLEGWRVGQGGRAWSDGRPWWDIDFQIFARLADIFEVGRLIEAQRLILLGIRKNVFDMLEDKLVPLELLLLLFALATEHMVGLLHEADHLEHSLEYLGQLFTVSALFLDRAIFEQKLGVHARNFFLIDHSVFALDDALEEIGNELFEGRRSGVFLGVMLVAREVDRDLFVFL